MDPDITSLALHFAAAVTGASIALRDREAGTKRRMRCEVSELSGLSAREVSPYRTEVVEAFLHWAKKPYWQRRDADLSEMRWRLPANLYPLFDQHIHLDDIPGAPTELGAQLDFYAQPENSERLRDTLLGNVRQFLHSTPVREYLRS